MIRSARPSEKRELEELQLRASLTNAGDREALLENPDAIDLPMEQIDSGDVFVMETPEGIAGFAALQPRADGNLELDGLFVEPEQRRRGVGRQLVEHCAQIALRRGAHALHVIGNPHAEAFYLSCGFTTLGRTDTRFGTGELMKRVLQP